MEKIFCFIIVKINAPVIFHDNGYELRDYLEEKYSIADHLYDVSYDQLIIAIPDYGKGLGVSMNELREAVKSFVLAKIFHLSGCRSSNDIEPRKKLIVENERRNLSQRRTA